MNNSREMDLKIELYLIYYTAGWDVGGMTRTQRSSIDCLGAAAAGALISSKAECTQGACSLASES